MAEHGKEADAMDDGPWRVAKELPRGPVLYSDDFTFDVALRISGDFANAAVRQQYADWLAGTLNSAPALKAEVERLRACLSAYVQAVAAGGDGTKEGIMAAIREADNNARAALADKGGAR